jgi:hypothetical protein
MSDDFVKNFIETGGKPPARQVPVINTPEGKQNADKFFEGLDKVSGELGFAKVDDIKGMVVMALITSFIAHHGTDDERKRFSTLFNNFVAGFPELEKYMERIILLIMFCSVEKGAITLNDVFNTIPEINPSVLNEDQTKKEIVKEFAKQLVEPKSE